MSQTSQTDIGHHCMNTASGRIWYSWNYHFSNFLSFSHLFCIIIACSSRLLWFPMIPLPKMHLHDLSVILSHLKLSCRTILLICAICVDLSHFQTEAERLSCRGKEIILCQLFHNNITSEMENDIKLRVCLGFCGNMSRFLQCHFSSPPAPVVWQDWGNVQHYAATCAYRSWMLSASDHDGSGLAVFPPSSTVR